ncbi:MAG: peptidoglycan DD-metalloendopeptidase family protein [Saprospiraceae bacterium]|nr:peptidoglycan DD-metalloendopeptidase family protein [Saprospiraceae bacterium]
MYRTIISIIICCSFYNLNARTWKVGSSRFYTSPSQVSSLVSNYDTIEIDAEIYPLDVCFWTAHHLLIRGINGKAHLKSGGRSAGQKAIWVVQGDSTIIENIEFSECRVPDKNGAGIRLEGRHLVVRNCYFHHNEDGILAGDKTGSNIIIEFCEFAYNGYGDGLSHNIYINHVQSLVFRYNYSHDANVGHLFKSRAKENYILYNRLSGENGTGSYEIDLPNGGNSSIMGNIIQQGPNSQNSGIIAYGLEGLNNSKPHSLKISHNTIMNSRSNGIFINTPSITDTLILLNNVFIGNGTVINGGAISHIEYGTSKHSSVNYFNFKNPSKFDFTPLENSPCFNKGFFTEFLFPELTPKLQYKHPAQVEDRNTELINDIGAIEAHFLNPFVNPVKAEYKKDFIIVNYVDWSVNGIIDAYCGTKTYDGHEGTDFVLDGFISMKEGIDVVSVDKGIVTSIKDGLYDMETQINISKGLGNYICIKHEGNYYSYYAHLKKNSIRVEPGDTVRQNQIIAQVGSSGNSTDPHLHFELYWDSIQLIDPFKGSCGNLNSFWKDQLEYDTSHVVWRSGLLSGLTTLDSLRFNNFQKTEFNFDKDYYATYWHLALGLRKGDRYTFQWFNDAGQKVWQVEDISTSDLWYYYLWSNVDIKNLGVCDNCEVRYLVNNVEKNRIRFKVKKITDIEDHDDIPSYRSINNEIHFLNNVKILGCTNSLGQRINITCTDNRLDFSQYPSQIYLINVKEDNSHYLIKFIKL